MYLFLVLYKKILFFNYLLTYFYNNMLLFDTSSIILGLYFIFYISRHRVVDYHKYILKNIYIKQRIR